MALRQVRAHPGNGQWDRDLQRVEAEYLATGGEFYVGVIDERIVAMGALKRLTNGCAEIKRMRVHPRMQRRSLGAQMLRALERGARSRGASVLIAQTTIGQMAARRLYSGCGYREIGRRREGAFEVLTFEKRIPLTWASAGFAIYRLTDRPCSGSPVITSLTS